MEKKLYVGSQNPLKIKVSQKLAGLIFKSYQTNSFYCDSGILDGQPYGEKEIRLGCINRMNELRKRCDDQESTMMIVIENGFVLDEKDNDWYYDVALINVVYNGIDEWVKTPARRFPRKIIENQTKSENVQDLVNYLNKNTMSREKQLSIGIEKIYKNIVSTR